MLLKCEKAFTGIYYYVTTNYCQHKDSNITHSDTNTGMEPDYDEILLGVENKNHPPPRIGGLCGLQEFM